MELLYFIKVEYFPIEARSHYNNFTSVKCTSGFRTWKHVSHRCTADHLCQLCQHLLLMWCGNVACIFLFNPSYLFFSWKIYPPFCSLPSHGGIEATRHRVDDRANRSMLYCTSKPTEGPRAREREKAKTYILLGHSLYGECAIDLQEMLDVSICILTGFPTK